MHAQLTAWTFFFFRAERHETTLELKHVLFVTDSKTTVITLHGEVK